MFKLEEEKIFTVVKFERLAYLISNREIYISLHTLHYKGSESFYCYYSSDFYFILSNLVLSND